MKYLTKSNYGLENSHLVLVVRPGWSDEGINVPHSGYEVCHDTTVFSFTSLVSSTWDERLELVVQVDCLRRVLHDDREQLPDLAINCQILKLAGVIGTFKCCHCHIVIIIIVVVVITSRSPL